MELSDIRSFVAVADASGMRRAALQLGVRQSVLSRRIRNLEDYLGASLFERGRDGVRLTFAGARFLESVRLSLAGLDSAVRAVRSAGRAEEGLLRIGIVASLSTGFLRDLLSGWYQRHPGVRIELAAGSAHEHTGAILAREMDVTFVMGSPVVVGCDVEELWSEPVLAALPSDHSLAGRASIELTSLRDERFIVTREAPGPETYAYLLKRLSGLEQSPSIDEYGVGREALLSMVGFGFGVTLLCGGGIGVRYPDVTFVPVTEESLPFSAVWSPENDNPALRRLLSDARLLSRVTNGGSSQMPGPSP